jgi:hypothetical protein
MDVVRRIFDAPLDPNKGDGVMKGQMLAAPVKIVTARRWEGCGRPLFPRRRLLPRRLRRRDGSGVFHAAPAQSTMS